MTLGVPISSPPQATIVNPNQLIEQDMDCMSCGYNLRGLRLGGRCPECGAAISRSSFGNLLKYSDPDWVDQLRLGVLLMLWNILVGFVIGLASGLLRSLGFSAGWSVTLSLIPSGLTLWSMLLITAQEPRISLHEDTVSLRKFIRLGALLNVVGATIIQVAQTTLVPIWLIILALVLMLVGIGLYFGFFVYLRRFAMRIPDHSLAKSTGIVMWGVCVSYLLLSVAGAIGITAAVTSGRLTRVGTSFGSVGSVPPSSGTAMGGGTIAGMTIFGCLGGIPIIVFGIWWLILLFRYHRVFKQAAAEARQFSAAQPDGAAGGGDVEVEAGIVEGEDGQGQGVL